MSRRLVLVDPSLRDIRGHHYELTRNVTRGALASGLVVVWLVHKEFPATEIPDNVLVHRVFSETMYDKFVVRKERSKGAASGTSRIVRKIGWWVSLFREKMRLYGISLFGPSSATGDKHRCKDNESFSDALGRVLCQEEISCNDHLLIHTADATTYWGILDLVLKRGAMCLPYIHLCTPYDASTMPHQQKIRPVRKIVGYLADLGLLDTRIFLYAENDLLARVLEKWFECNVETLNLPPPEPDPTAVTPRRSDKSLTVAYLGAAREEKGFLLLPGLVSAIGKRYGTDGRVRFVIQCSPQIVGYRPTIIAAIDRLKKFPDSFVELRENVQETQEYYRMLQESDVVLMCYDISKYRHRGSGIAVEAVAMSKILLATTGTFPAYLAGDAAATGTTLDEYIEALGAIIRQPDVYRRAAARKGAAYRESNSASKYVASLLARAGRARVFQADDEGAPSGVGVAPGIAPADDGRYPAATTETTTIALRSLHISGYGRPGNQLLQSVTPDPGSARSGVSKTEYGRHLDRLVKPIGRGPGCKSPDSRAAG